MKNFADRGIYGRMRSRWGFTLLELLSVVAILGIVLAMAVPAISSLQESMQLTRAAQAISDTFALARQTALAHNRNIAVRVFQPETGGAFFGCQAFILEDDGNEEPLGRFYRLPAGVVLSENEKHTRLPAAATNVVQLAGPEMARYSEFWFRRNGGTDLSTTQFWYLTLVGEREKEKDVPANFVALLIEPGNGTIQMSRP